MSAFVFPVVIYTGLKLHVTNAAVHFMVITGSLLDRSAYMEMDFCHTSLHSLMESLTTCSTF